MQSSVCEGLLQIYPVEKLFPRYLYTQFIDTGMFHQAWLRHPLFPYAQPGNYLIAVNDRWTSKQQKHVQGADVLTAEKRYGEGWRTIRAEHRRRCATQEQRRELLHAWLNRSIEFVVKQPSPLSIIVLYQGKDYDAVRRMMTGSLESQDLELQAAERNPAPSNKSLYRAYTL